MKKIKIGVLALSALIMFGLSSCSDSNDEMVVGTWTISKYLRNGVDETSKVKITNYVETYSEDGTYSRTYTDGDGKGQSDPSGKWTLTEDEKQFKIQAVSSLSDFSDEHSSLSSNYYDIDKLEGSSLWYSYHNGSDDHQFQMVKN